MDLYKIWVKYQTKCNHFKGTHTHTSNILFLKRNLNNSFYDYKLAHSINEINIFMLCIHLCGAVGDCHYTFLINVNFKECDAKCFYLKMLFFSN